MKHIGEILSATIVARGSCDKCLLDCSCIVPVPMTYKTILTYLDGDDGSESQIKIAAELTHCFNAHLTIAALGYHPEIPPTALPGGIGEVMDIRQQSENQADARVQHAKDLMQQNSIEGKAVRLVSAHTGLSKAFGNLARFADLVVLRKPSDLVLDQAAVSLIEGSLFDGDAAILVCPPDARSLPGEKVVIGWNNDHEALRAVRRALPFLRRASTVEIAIFGGTAVDSQFGDELVAFLEHHGVRAEANASRSGTEDVASLLQQRVDDIKADLLVTGAYGHSRFREYLIGGTTRQLLEVTSVPVLMAH